MEKTYTHPAPTELKARVSFRTGENGVFIGTWQKKIVIAKPEAIAKLKIETGIYYDCTLIDSFNKKSFILTSAVKAPTIKTDLDFRTGKEGDMVGSYNSTIVIAPKHIKVKPNTNYNCEIVESPKGNAFLLVSAKEQPSTAVGELVSNGYPTYTVEVKIDGRFQHELKFEAMGGTEELLKRKVRDFGRKNFLNKVTLMDEYEKTCRKFMQEHLNRIYTRNATRM